MTPVSVARELLATSPCAPLRSSEMFHHEGRDILRLLAMLRHTDASVVNRGGGTRRPRRWIYQTQWQLS